MQELSGVSEAARELAMSRFRLIQPHLEKNRPLQLVASDSKLPFRTAQRWVSQYRKFGLIALVRKSRDDRGGRRVSVALICWMLLSQIFRTGIVTSARVQGGVAVYLLLGVAWAHCYQIANRLMPGSFQSSVGGSFSVVEWFYYSFTTLTTLGYGDIVPIKPLSRSLAIGEALTDQLYLTVLIARLVAQEVMSWQPRSNDRPDE
jgi:hypothetical protein